ncbi:MAG: monomethylamine:corrinoid methyltransferase, partial [Chloroflexi bacterium]|nr:monomethylamine:corrinoid methyltransferase [Chloroflexota bacterium]
SAISATASGMAYCWIGGTTGLEVRITGEILNGVAGMPRDKVNDLVNRIMAKVDELMEQIPASATAKLFPDLYDIKTVRPKPEYAALCSRATEKLAELGVPLSSRLVIA